MRAMRTRSAAPGRAAGRRAGRRVSRRLLGEVTGLVEPGALGLVTARALAQELRLPVALFALADPDDGSYAMRGTWGTRGDALARVRLRPAEGMGGRVVTEGRTLVAEDYLTDHRISGHFRPEVGQEDLHGMAAVPVLDGARPIGVVYGALRSVGRPPDRVVSALETASTTVAPVLATALTAQRRLRRQVHAERQRLAGALHDDVGGTLFALGAAARKAGALAAASAPELRRIVEQIEQHTRMASRALRGVLSDLAPDAPGERLPVAAQRDLDDFAERHGIPAYLLVQGTPAPLPAPVETALLACLRQALFNVGRHAEAGLVMVTVDYGPGWVTLAVQDDGQGPPEGFSPQAVPDGGRHWGLASALRQVGQLGGTVSLVPEETGGTVLRVRVPVTF